MEANERDFLEDTESYTIQLSNEKPSPSSLDYSWLDDKGTDNDTLAPEARNYLAQRASAGEKEKRKD